jgi:aspartyl-tRNA(Asn)/glutamyl-tRNA(Gln) amidotransferase subunit C
LSLDPKTVRTIAYLARIRLADDEVEGLARELSSILGWVEQLAEVDTEGVEPMTSVAAMSLPLRADVVTDGARAQDVVRNAPEPIEAFFTVPKVVE